jgi:protein disulfide-isomerase A6
MYDSSDDVVILNEGNFQKEVVQSDSVWLVEFYAPW